MVKPCPNCGAIPVAEARFCRMCGTPLKPAGRGETDVPVSPLAQTIPLSEEGRATDGLSADKPGRAASDTSRVGRTEMENLLRRAPALERAAAGESHQALGADGKEESAPQTTALVVDATNVERAPESTRPPEKEATPAGKPAPSPPNARSRRMWQVTAIILLCVALVAGALAFILSRRANSTDAGSASSPISINDQKQLVNDKLAEAEVLLSSGEFNRAVSVLRAAVKLDPENPELRIRLGNALERTGARDEAIAEYRAATESSPDNATAWRTLASAQFEERLYNEAAESYEHLVATTGQDETDDETWLAYADAARLAGRKDEARSLYQRVVNSSSQEVAQAARRYLAELGPAAATVANNERGRDVREMGQPPERAPEATQPQPTPTPRATPSPTATGSVAQNDYDAYYFQAVNIVNGRDPKAIERAELLRALALFQRAALGGLHRTEAQRYADRLGKEYDRRRK